MNAIPKQIPIQSNVSSKNFFVLLSIVTNQHLTVVCVESNLNRYLRLNKYLQLTDSVTIIIINKCTYQTVRRAEEERYMSMPTKRSPTTIDLKIKERKIYFCGRTRPFVIRLIHDQNIRPLAPPNASRECFMRNIQSKLL